MMSDGEVPCVTWDMGDGSTAVFERVCPECRRFLNAQKAKFWSCDWSGKYRVAGFICKTHGEVKPEFIGYF